MWSDRVIGSGVRGGNPREGPAGPVALLDNLHSNPTPSTGGGHRAFALARLFRVRKYANVGVWFAGSLVQKPDDHRDGRDVVSLLNGSGLVNSRSTA